MTVPVLLHDLFHWPDGIVVGNLLASLLWVPLQQVGVHLRLKRHARETHGRLDAQDAELAEMRDILEELRRSGPELQRQHDSS